MRSGDFVRFYEFFFIKMNLAYFIAKAYEINLSTIFQTDLNFIKGENVMRK